MKRLLAYFLTVALIGAIAMTAAAENTEPPWQMTEDGQFLYKNTTYSTANEDCVQVVYIGDDTDVTVPATFGGKFADKVLCFTTVVGDGGFGEGEQAREWLAANRAVARRYLNLSFEEGPTTVVVQPTEWPTCLWAQSVTLPKSATEAKLFIQGMASLTAPEDSALTKIAVYSSLENVPNPTPATMDLTAAENLKTVGILRDDYWGVCFAEGSVLKLPNACKALPIIRAHGGSDGVIIAEDPMSLTVQYADGETRPIPAKPTETQASTTTTVVSGTPEEPSVVSHVSDVPPILGDANGDNSVDMKDVLLMRQYIAHLSERDIVVNAADFNGDGSIDMKDVLLVRKRIAGQT